MSLVKLKLVTSNNSKKTVTSKEVYFHGKRWSMRFTLKNL